MEALKLSDVFPVQRPRLTAIEETSEHDCLVHFEIDGQLHVPVIHNSGAQVTEGLANLTDTISLSREASEDVTLVLDQTSDQPGHHCQQCQTHISAHLTKIPDLRHLLILFAIPRDLVLAWDSLPEFPT